MEKETHVVEEQEESMNALNNEEKIKIMRKKGGSKVVTKSRTMGVLRQTSQTPPNRYEQHQGPDLALTGQHIDAKSKLFQKKLKHQISIKRGLQNRVSAPNAQLQYA